ncbi:MAG: hypothetical protein WCN95_02815 [bacterium]
MGIMEVPPSVKREAVLCNHDCSCVTNGQCGDKEICKVDFAVGRKILFLTNEETIFCPYRVSYGSRQACICPVHCYIEGKGLYKSETTEKTPVAL